MLLQILSLNLDCANLLTLIILYLSFELMIKMIHSLLYYVVLITFVIYMLTPLLQYR